MRPDLPLLAAALALAGLACSAPALAQYKVVGPDGRITYTDRPVAAQPGSQVLPLRHDAIADAAGPPLPIDLREPVARFPVTLLSSANCPPCDSGRQLLQQRGVPYTERLVASNDDIAALQRLSGARTVPALTVGSQALRGFQAADWQATLDLAGYPRESRLPRNWVQPAPTPLVARTPLAEAGAPVVNAPVAPGPPAETPAGAGGIRF